MATAKLPQTPPGIDPAYLETINLYLDGLTNYGADIDVVRDNQILMRDIANRWNLPTQTMSGYGQLYREANYMGDDRCLYVIAHEGKYGAKAPWRLLGTRYGVPESVRRQYRQNEIRHLAWEVYDHAKKEVKSFGAETRAALMMDPQNSRHAEALRIMFFDYGRDVLLHNKTAAQQRAESLMDTMGVPRRMRAEYFRFFLDPFWPVVEAMIDEELDLISILLPPPATNGATP